MESRFQRNFGEVQIHSNNDAATSAQRMQSAAYTVGNHVVFAANQYQPSSFEGRALLAHELTHTLQQRQSIATQLHSLAENSALEENADRHAERAMTEGSPPPLMQTSIRAPMRSMAEKILLRAAKWMSKRTATLVSKHIARHARRIAGRAIHTVFKSPKDIGFLIRRTVKEAAQVAAKHAKAPVTQVLEEGGVKIARQARGPGKFRWLVQKTFANDIGTKGERILRVIIDQSGRVVSAFPADRLLTIGVGIAAAEIISERSARANEAIRQEDESQARSASESDGISWEDFIPFVGDIYGGSLNAGEDAMLRDERSMRSEIDDIIAEVEYGENRTLSPKEREELGATIRAAIVAPLVALDEP